MYEAVRIKGYQKTGEGDFVRMVEGVGIRNADTGTFLRHSNSTFIVFNDIAASARVVAGLNNDASQVENVEVVV